MKRASCRVGKSFSPPLRSGVTVASVGLLAAAAARLQRILNAAQEGLILVRAVLGFNSAVTVAGTGVTEASWDAMRPQINASCGTNF